MKKKLLLVLLGEAPAFVPEETTTIIKGEFSPLGSFLPGKPLPFHLFAEEVHREVQRHGADGLLLGWDTPLWVFHLISETAAMAVLRGDFTGQEVDVYVVGAGVLLPVGAIAPARYFELVPGIKPHISTWGEK